MLTFPEDYFEAKIIDDFYVRPMIRRAWAAQMEVLAAVDQICKRHNIKYYAEFGTLLGAIRHQGFIPWDDDLDIGMLRDDYQRFHYYAKQELPEDLHLVDAYEHNGFKQLLTRVVNSFRINPSDEFMKKYHDCPYCVGVDIFVTDYFPRNEEDSDTYFQLLKGVGGLATTWEDADKQESRWAVLDQIEEITGVKIDREDNIQNQLFQLTDQISRMYGPEDADEVGLAVLVEDFKSFRFPKSYYETTIEVPFENITIPVPVEYEKVVRGRYGDNYMIPVKRWNSHSYPFFKEQEKKLLEVLKGEGIEARRYLDIMPIDERERFYGVQYHENLNSDILKTSSFDNIELKITDLDAYQNAKINKKVAGVCINAEVLVGLGLREIIKFCLALEAKYICIDTREFTEPEKLDEILTSENELLRWTDIYIYLENGFVTDSRGRLKRSMYSDIDWLNETIDAYNMLCGRDVFGICMNVGYANLLNLNLRSFVESAGNRLFLIHMNDNAGQENEQQLPFSFTRGRGSRTTDLYRLIGILVKSEYRGGIVFDTCGLWENAPILMQNALLKLLWALSQEWDEQFKLKEKLEKENTKIVLFGAGAMALNYMNNWGSVFTPVWVVDNNKERWGMTFCGVPIKNPESILEIPEEDRNVFICNMYYAQVASQLDQMGVKYDYYKDNYFM